MIRLITAISCWMGPGFRSSNFWAISITFTNERRSPFSALLRHTSAAATILGTLRNPSASLIRTVLKKTSLSSAAVFFLPLGRPFGFPDWPALKRVCMSLRSRSAIFAFRAGIHHTLVLGTAAAPVGDLFKGRVRAVEARRLSAVALPASYGGVDVLRVDLDAVPTATGFLCGD